MTRIPEGLAQAGEIIAALHEARTGDDPVRDATRMRKALRPFEPLIDEYADTDTAAEWLGMKRDSIYRERSRQLADGSPSWPAPDLTAGRSAMWTYRTLATHRALMPGQGSAGRGRPRRVDLLEPN